MPGRTASRVRRLVSASLVALVITSLWSTQATAQSVPPESPGTHIQVWTINIKHLALSWEGLIQKMLVAPFPPDIVLGQEMSSSAAFTFATEMNDVFAGGANRYRFESSTGNNTVIWNRNRFTRIASSEFSQIVNGCASGSTARAVNLRDELASDLFLETRNVVAASVHLPVNASEACVTHATFQINQNIETLASTRRMTIVGGDFNVRPDEDADLPTNGLETDPDCWYRKFSQGHEDLLIGCGTGAQDRYYDTVWVHPDSGGTVNPMIPSACQQFTSSRVLQPVAPELKGATNSCTDLVNNGSGAAGQDGKLDKNRIDFIWTSYENPSGTAWRPPAQAIVPFVAYASADLGLSLDAGSLGTSYSDRRAVNSLLVWPPAMP